MDRRGSLGRRRSAGVAEWQTRGTQNALSQDVWVRVPPPVLGALTPLAGGHAEYGWWRRERTCGGAPGARGTRGDAKRRRGARLGRESHHRYSAAGPPQAVLPRCAAGAGETRPVVGPRMREGPAATRSGGVGRIWGSSPTTGA